MRRVDVFSGLLTCRECQEAWFATWSTRAPILVCHNCGGQCVPEGLQVPTAQVPSAIDGEIYRLKMRQHWKGMS